MEVIRMHYRPDWHSWKVFSAPEFDSIQHGHLLLISKCSNFGLDHTGVALPVWACDGGQGRCSCCSPKLPASFFPPWLQFPTMWWDLAVACTVLFQDSGVKTVAWAAENGSFFLVSRSDVREIILNCCPLDWSQLCEFPYAHTNRCAAGGLAWQWCLEFWKLQCKSRIWP